MGAAVKVYEYTHIRPHNDPPTGPPVTLAQRREALIAAFRGVELGRYDSELIRTLADLLLDEPARALVSMIERVRGAGKLDGWNIRSADSDSRPILDPNTPYVDGNSDPGYDR
jgi:hypothetical protein